VHVVHDRKKPRAQVAAVAPKVKLAPGTLERILNEIVRRHESLRTIFSEVDGQPVQTILSHLTLPLSTTNFEGLDDDEKQAVAKRRAHEEAERSFNLACGPLLCASLLRFGEEDHVLFLTMHHIVSDAWSMNVLLRELVALYECFSMGQKSLLAELPIQYADYAIWQREWLKGAALEEHLSYWRRSLAGAQTVFQLATDYPRPAIQSFKGAVYKSTLPDGVSDLVKAICQKEDCTPYMLLLACFGVLLHRYTQEKDICIGIVDANRDRIRRAGASGGRDGSLAQRSRRARFA